MRVSDAIKFIVKESGQTQEFIAKEMGYKQQRSLSTTMKGKNPTIKNIIKLADIMDYNVVLVSNDNTKDAITLIDNNGEYNGQDTNN